MYGRDINGNSTEILNFAYKDNRDAYYASNNYTPFYAETKEQANARKAATERKKKAAADVSASKNKTTSASSRNRRISGQTI